MPPGEELHRAVYDHLGRRQEALGAFQCALAIWEEVGDRAGESVTRYNLAMVYRQQGRLREAAEEPKQGVGLDASVQNPDLEQHRAMLARVEAERRAQQPEGGGP